LALIPGNVLETDDGVLAAEVATAKLPVTSVRHWKKYLDTLSALYQRPSYAVVTRISCTPDPKTQFKVNFEVVGGVDAERLAAISSKIELVEPTLLKPYEPAGEEEEEAPETKAAKKKRAKKLD
jgi:hypothetical protein